MVVEVLVVLAYKTNLGLGKVRGKSKEGNVNNSVDKWTPVVDK